MNLIYWLIGGFIVGVLLSVLRLKLAASKFEGIRQFDREREIIRQARQHKRPRAMATRVDRSDLPSILRKQGF